ncbi:MAG: ABC transporter permease [Treponema sp.]|nr:ABC transporter permease [Treponema sp.]
MNSILSIIAIVCPLLLLTAGALISEYAGRMALFLDGTINLAAFLCYALTVTTGSVVLSSFLSCLITVTLTFCLERIASKNNANMFLVSLAINLLFSALVSLLSSILFGTRGVLYSSAFAFNAPVTRTVTSLICALFSAGLLLFLSLTRQGLRMRITGSSPEVLIAQGISADWYRSLSWICAALCGSVAGCVYVVRLNSFVPGMAGGRGWTALAAVFLGRKHPALVVLAVLVFALAEHASSYAQNIPQLQTVSSSLLFALPYLLALLLIAVTPQNKNQ